MLVIPNERGQNDALVKQINDYIQKTLQQGVKEGLWKPGDHVETPMGQNSRGVPRDEVSVIADRITGYVQGVPVPATMLGLPFEDIEINMWPGRTADGTKRVFAELEVYLVPDARLPF